MNDNQFTPAEMEKVFSKFNELVELVAEIQGAKPSVLMMVHPNGKSGTPFAVSTSTDKDEITNMIFMGAIALGVYTPGEDDEDEDEPIETTH